MTANAPTKLTIKQERFCEIYLQIGNASEAYRQAYNANGKTETINRAAKTLLDHPKVAARLQQFRNEANERIGVTLDSLLAELEEARTVGRLKEQASGMVAATMGKARLTGLDEPKGTPPREFNVNVRRIS